MELTRGISQQLRTSRESYRYQKFHRVEKKRLRSLPIYGDAMTGPDNTGTGKNKFMIGAVDGKDNHEGDAMTGPDNTGTGKNKFRIGAVEGKDNRDGDAMTGLDNTGNGKNKYMIGAVDELGTD